MNEQDSQPGQQPDQQGDQQGDFTQRIGKSFVLFAWLAGLALLSWLFAGLEEAEKNPNQVVQTQTRVDGSREVILERNRFGHYVSSGKINGRTVTFLLDTGASDVSIPESVAGELGLRRGPEQVYNTANGQITGYLTTIDRISIGGIELYNISASINPYKGDDEILLGMSFLNKLDYRQRGNTLTIRKTN